jgi:hypothetical protein
MQGHKIDHAVNRIGITYSSPQQVTILAMVTGELLYGFFKELLPVEENKWIFSKLNGSEDLIIDGGNIRSITLEENGQIIYHCTDNDEQDNLHLSIHK